MRAAVGWGLLQLGWITAILVGARLVAAGFGDSTNWLALCGGAILLGIGSRLHAEWIKREVRRDLGVDW